MIYRYVLALISLLAVSSSWAQIRVELEFEQESFLPREPLWAVVRVSNNSGRTLVLGQDSEWLSFTVENVDGPIVKQLKPADVEGEFSLPSSKRAKKVVDIAAAYDLSRFGRYIVTATVRIPEWQQSFSSKPVPVGIATGVKLWETTFGMPGDTQGRPELRRFQLVSANHLKKLSLYVRITGESEGDTITLFPLGQMHGFSRPEPQIDRWSNLHVLYQDGARSFRYNLITPDGVLLSRQTWEVTNDSRPALKIDSTGHIAVSGGIRRVTPLDLPPPDLLTENNDPVPQSSSADRQFDAKSSTK